MDASQRGVLLNKLADLIERDHKYLAVNYINTHIIIFSHIEYNIKFSKYILRKFFERKFESKKLNYKYIYRSNQ